MKPISDIVASLVHRLADNLTNTLADGAPDQQLPVDSNRSDLLLLDLTNSDRFVVRAYIIWKLCLFTLPLDLFIAFATQAGISSVESHYQYHTALYVLMGVSLALADYDRALKVIGWLKHFALTKWRWMVALVLVSSVGAIIYAIVNLAANDDIESIAPLAVLFISIIGGIPTIIKYLYKSREYHQELTTNKQFWIDQISQNLFILKIAPIISSRLISLISAIAALQGVYTSGYFALFTLTSLFFLLAMTPRREDFYIPCPKCAAWTSRIFYDSFGCPSCSEKMYKGYSNRVVHQLSNEGAGINPFTFVDQPQRPQQTDQPSPPGLTRKIFEGLIKDSDRWS